MMFCTKILMLFGIVLGTVSAWDSEELEIFDVVEEINKNFYEFMGISQEATNQEIKRAFRNLSIVLHPDKNSAEDANIQFRNLVSIYEVLKDPSKREKYNKVLKEGLPNWKSALYYYRRMRKIGLYEGSLIVFIIITIGQYLFAWAAYLEKKFTAEQVFGTKLKKLQKKNKNINMETILNEIPMPSLLNTLPFQIPLAIWNLPGTIKSGLNKANELKEIALEHRRIEAEEARLREEAEKELEEQLRLRKEKKENLRKRKQNSKVPEKTDAELQGYAKIQARELNKNDTIKPASHKSTISGGFWTDEDLTELIRLVKKYPSGSSSRWDTIAETMNRTVQEVTFMAAKMKENGYRIQGQTDSVAENLVQDATATNVRKEKIKKTADNDILISETNWSQEQQRALESALVKYKKTASGDRWQKIANCVPEKTKQECQLRYKYLCEVVKTQKKTAEAAEANDEPYCKVEPVQDDLTAEKRVSDTGAADDGVVEDAPDANDLLSAMGNKKRNKRKERRRRRDFSSDEDSDDAYHYEMS